MSSSKFQQLPEGIIMDILSRLTVKTLFCNCRLVCKSWLCLISVPSFARLQGLRSPAGILVIKRMPETVLDFTQFEVCVAAAGSSDSMLYSREVQRMKFSHRNKSLPNSTIYIRNSCNGLLCLSTEVNNEPLYVCNPILGEFIAIPPPTSINDRSYLHYFVALGFCVANNEYKVLRMKRSNGRVEVGSGAAAEVYTIGTQVWRSIASAPQFVLGDGAYLDGICHWVCCHTSEFIQTFNYEKEEFGLLLMPRYYRYDSREKYLFLDVLGGCLILSVWEVHSGFRSQVMWLMNDYGVQESWVKIVVIENTSSYYEPVMYWSDEEILMRRDHRTLVFYNQKMRSFREITSAYNAKPLFYAIDYSPTLISLYDVSPGEEVKRVLAEESTDSDGSENLEVEKVHCSDSDGSDVVQILGYVSRG